MNIDFSPQEEAFREEVRQWLKKALPPDWGPFSYHRMADQERANCSRDWDRKVYEGGFAGVSWPKEYGGRGATQLERAIFYEELARHYAPRELGHSGKDLLGPTMIVHGTEEQKKRFLPRILSAADIWCQGFSEPNAGSDLAGVQTRAVLQGDRFIVNGQKVWTSWAQYANWIFALVRTDPEAPKHKGITFLLIDMTSPGITVRPLRQITGKSEFNEVFLENVEVPRENALGQINDGWNVAMTTLSHERSYQLLGQVVSLFQIMEQMRQYARNTIRNGAPLSKDPLIRSKMARCFSELEVLRYISYRTITSFAKGREPGFESSLTKLLWSESNRAMTELAMELQGPFSQLMHGSPMVVNEGLWQTEFLQAKGLTIAAGTSQIQKNIISERILGLPR